MSSTVNNYRFHAARSVPSSLAITLTILLIGCAQSGRPEYAAVKEGVPPALVGGYVADTTTAGADLGGVGSIVSDLYGADHGDGFTGTRVSTHATAGSDRRINVVDQPDPAEPIDRRIVYESTLRIVVTDFEGLEQQMIELAAKHHGYLASARIDRATGTRRTGAWVARVPVDRYRSFLEDVVNIGILESRDEDARDVTEEFVDLDARLKNKKELERRMLQLLDRANDELKNVIEVERELARVREEIERMEGRMRYLLNITSLTTVRIHAREQRDYTPPQAPTLGNRINEAWVHSLTSMQRAGEQLLVGTVASIPWLALFALPAAFLIWGIRRVWSWLRIARRESPATAAP